MAKLPDLKNLTEKAKDALIAELWKELQKLRQQLEKKTKKTSRNSSLSPAKGFKAEIKNQEESNKGERLGSLGREGGVEH